MKKMMLDLDRLNVESFSADDGIETAPMGQSLPTRPLCSRYCPSGDCDTATCTVDVCC
jgi:hypothetical protein